MNDYECASCWKIIPEGANAHENAQGDYICQACHESMAEPDYMDDDIDDRNDYQFNQNV